MSLPLDPKLLAAFVVAGLALNVTPGPDMLFVLASGARGGRGAGVRAALGVGAGCIVHTLAATAGLSAMLASSAALFTIVKLAGAGYLLYLGAIALLRREDSTADALSESTTIDAAGAKGVFRRAVLTNLLNPKVALFFLAFVPQFVSPARGHLEVQFLLLGALFNTTGTCVNVLVGIFAATIGQRLSSSARLRSGLGRVTGAIFVALGLRLAFAGQR